MIPLFRLPLAAALALLLAVSLGETAQAQSSRELRQSMPQWLETAEFVDGLCGDANEARVDILLRRNRRTVVLYPADHRPPAAGDAGARVAFTQNAARVSEAAPNEALPEVFQEVRILGRARRSDRLLISWRPSAQAPRRCVWASPHWLLSSDPEARAPQPLRMSDAPAGEIGNLLNMKVTLNPLQIDAENEGVSFFNLPGQDERRTNFIFGVFNVYAFERRLDPNGLTSTNWLLLGRDDGSTTQIEGWVRQSQVYFWGSRVTAFWGGTGVASCGLETEGASGQTFREPRPEREIERVSRRFPIIEVRPRDALDGRTLAEGRDILEPVDPLVALGGVESFTVALPSRACRPGEADCISDEEYLRERSRVAEILARQQTVDVLFLVDGTFSMRTYFPLAAEAAQRVATDVQTANRNIRFGMTLYSDYRGRTADYREILVDPIVPFHFLEDREFRNLRLAEPLGDPQADRAEASLGAVLQAIETADWRAAAGMRVIIHVADHGSREPRDGGALVERTTAAAVAAALRRDQRVFYFPIAVRGDYGPENERFLAQSRAVAAAAQDWARPPIETFASPQDQDLDAARARIEEAIREVLDGLDQVRRDVERTIVCANAPESRVCQAPPTEPTETSPEESFAAVIARTLSQRDGLTERELGNIYNRRQTVAPATCAPIQPVDGAPRSVFSYWVAFEPARFGRVVDVANAFCLRVRRNDFSNLEDMFGETLAGASGDDVSLSELIRRSLGIPTVFMHPVLSTPITDVEDQIGFLSGDEGGGFEEVLRYFCSRSLLLSQIDANRRLVQSVDLETAWDPEQQNYLVRDGDWEPFEWNPPTDIGERYIYVPVEYLF